MKSDEVTTALSIRQVGYLERLSEELASRGLRVRLRIPVTGSPALHVLNPDAFALTEDIHAEFTDEGWCFLWSWAERIGSADDVSGVADLVERVLFV